MSFDIKNTFGEITNFYNINVESGASLTLNIGSGGGKSSSNGTKFKKCPIAITKEERTTYASMTCSVPHAQPEGWEVESWSSEKAFTSKPEGLEDGGPIFYWCTDGKEVPSGFTAVKKEGTNIIIVPSDGNNNDEITDISEDDDSSSSLSSLDSEDEFDTTNIDDDFSSGEDLEDD